MSYVLIGLLTQRSLLAMNLQPQHCFPESLLLPPPPKSPNCLLRHRYASETSSAYMMPGSNRRYRKI
eukprot:3928044-Rhodomonas_salina.3